MDQQLISILEKSLNIPAKNIQTVLDMVANGATVPFIARYRKEETGNLDEDAIRSIEQQYAYQQSLMKRKEDIIRLIEEKGLMNDTLRKQILDASRLVDVEDLYRPYKEKKKTKATAALAAGLGPLADQIMKFSKTPLEQMGNEKELEGAGYIIAEHISDSAEARKWIADYLKDRGILSSKKKKDAQDEGDRFAMYYDFSEAVKRTPPHRIMALNRGEDLKILTVTLDADDEPIVRHLEGMFIRSKSSPSAPFVKECIKDALKRLILPSVKRQIRSELSTQAEDSSIASFSDNLEHLLMTCPIKGQRVLGFDPGYRHGCKLAAVDEKGSLLETAVIYPTQSEFKQKEAARVMEDLIRKYQLQIVAIGNGTASRESEQFVAEICKKHPGLKYTIVSEAGASVYSASPLAAEEFPDLAIETRSAVSIARRLQDPLSELVKIDPKSIGVGEYQHDVNQKKLAEALDFTTEKVVNKVGININTASRSILQYVSGLNKTSIAKLYAYKSSSPIRSREEIAQIKGISQKTYEQCIGFLRIPESANPLDNTGIHPESYDLAMKVLEKSGLSLNDLHSRDFRDKLMRVSPVRLARDLGSDPYTMSDILHELLSPGLDPRDSLDAPLLRADVMELKDLKPGMQLQGTVRNVTSFGAFVDIGVHEDGLVHVSQLSNRFVKDPKEVVRVGDIVTCWVLETDERRKRISLTMKSSK